MEPIEPMVDILERAKLKRFENNPIVNKVKDEMPNLLAVAAEGISSYEFIVNIAFFKSEKEGARECLKKIHKFKEVSFTETVDYKDPNWPLKETVIKLSW